MTTEETTDIAFAIRSATNDGGNSQRPRFHAQLVRRFADLIKATKERQRERDAIAAESAGETAGFIAAGRQKIPPGKL